VIRSLRLHGLSLCLALLSIVSDRLGAATSSQQIQTPTLGTKTFHFIPAEPGTTNSLGTIALLSGTGPSAAVIHLRIFAPDKPLMLRRVYIDSRTHLLRMIFAPSRGNPAEVDLSARQEGHSLRLILRSSSSEIAQVDAGSWLPQLRARTIPVPYDSGTISYSPVLHRFLSLIWDIHQSHATTADATAVHYLPRTDQTRLQLHEDLLVTASAEVDDVLPLPRNNPSPFIQDLAGRLILDIWDVGFAEIRRGLDQLADYGISNCIAVVHDWQRFGYDNGLPQHLPANPELGGDAGLQALIESAHRANCRLALHENYTDAYPNSPAYSQADLALGQNGSPIPAWLNGQGIQSFQTRPDRMRALAQTESPEIHSRYHTGAGFLDVNSAVQPWEKGDRNAAAPHAGSMQSWLTASAQLWAFERSTHGGPILGEGGSHWFYSGLLDGVEAQFGAGSVPQQAGDQVPLFVDFDLLRIHPLQVNHGMGYYARWSISGVPSLTQDEIDAYRMQEIIFGHSPYVATPFWSDVMHAFIEQNLVGPVARRYGTHAVRSIRYESGGQWLSPSIAVLSGHLARPEVTYKDGPTIVANAAPANLHWHGLIIPHHGWAALAPGLLAYTALCGTIVCDYAQTPLSLFASPRNPADQPHASAMAAPQIQEFQLHGLYSLELQLSWRVSDTPDGEMNVFVHLVDERGNATDEGTILQDDHPALPRAQWKPGTVLAESVRRIDISGLPDGTYSLRVGLTRTNNQQRLLLHGIDDGQRRYKSGILTIEQHHATVSFHAIAPSPGLDKVPISLPPLQIGLVAADGTISLLQSNGRWILTPYSRNRIVTVAFDKDVLPMPDHVTSDSGADIQLISDGSHWQLRLQGSRSYSWRAAGVLPVILPQP
jgi:hypothetical protein